ncbi:MAG: substrate-binding domain-containing protein [Candidatus Delongbacteria bacterium]|nr:substrate-binding domain-containing protein [Candidatus Delongbacteria bacterium]MBN2836886.1 substrate-binding domain-containing protein [Candidatus Delongbacteria bacterium]
MKLLIPIFALLLFFGCSSDKNPPELLLFSGVTMAKAAQEVCKEFEKENNCIIKINYGGSGNLIKMIQYNKTGDIFLPGSEKFYDDIDFYEDTALVGVNQLAIMIPKGNPKRVMNDIYELLREDLRCVVGNPESGSVGKETEIILKKSGIEKEVLLKAIYLTTDSKDLTKSITEGKADITLNWKAAIFKNDASKSIDILELPEKLINRNLLIVSDIKYSKNPDLAKKFIQFCKTDKCKQIFKDFGF